MGARPLAIGIDGRELAGRPTGTGRYLRNLLRHWREGGDELFVYFNGAAPADPVLDHPSIRLRPLGDGRPHGLTWLEAVLPSAARADRLDVFFSPAYSCPLTLAVPRVTAVHDLSFFAYPQDFRFAEAMRRRALVAASVRASAVVLVCSDFTRRELGRLLPSAAGRARLVPLGADDDLSPSPPKDAARARLGLTGPLVLTVGTVLTRRCAPELLRATALLRHSHPGLLLDVVGDNRTRPRIDLAALVSEQGLDGHVRLSGFVDEAGLADRYAAADVAVFLSEYEGFGLPALEAAARGVPLVASRAPALGEIFAEAALLVDPRDEPQVARAIDQLLRDAALRTRLIAAGRSLAARHSWRRTAELTRDALVSAARS